MEGVSVFGNKIDWCSKNVYPPTRDELSNLTLCEACLKVSESHFISQ